MRRRRDDLSRRESIVAVTAIAAPRCTPASGRRPELPPGPHTRRRRPPTRCRRSKLEHLIFIVQENRSFDHYFGTYPGADGIPTNARRLVRGVRARPVAGRQVRPAVRRRTRSSSTADRTTSRRRSRTSTAARWTGSSGSLDARPDEVLGRPDAAPLRPAPRPAGPARRDEHAPPELDPELLVLGRSLRAAGRDVHVGRLVEPALAPVPDVGVVGLLPRSEGPDVVPVEPDPEALRAAVGLRRPSDLRVDRHHVAAGSRRRVVALLHRLRHVLGAAVPRRTQPGARRPSRVFMPVAGFTSFWDGERDGIHDNLASVQHVPRSASDGTLPQT